MSRLPRLVLPVLVSVAPVLERYGRFADFLGEGSDDSQAWRALRMSETSGRPLGNYEWLDALGEISGRTLKAQKRRPKPKLSVFSKLAP